MKTVRQRVLEFIRTHRSVTATELGSAFHMTPANARHHLAILMELGLVEVANQRHAEGKGRPARVFAVSRQSAGHNLDQLSSALLDLQQVRREGDTARGSMELLVEEMAARMQPAGSDPGENAPRNLTRSLNHLTRVFNRHHYASRWEAHPGRPHLILGNCPYQPIIGGHPELCWMDAGIIQQFLGVAVNQEAKLKRDPSGMPYCLFLIGKEQV